MKYHLHPLLPYPPFSVFLRNIGSGLSAIRGKRFISSNNGRTVCRVFRRCTGFFNSSSMRLAKESVMSIDFESMRSALLSARAGRQPGPATGRPTLSLARSGTRHPISAPAAPGAPARKVGPPRGPPQLRNVYFFIWTQDGYRPSKRYGSVELARQEQTRLKALSPAREFHVYEARLVQDHHYTEENVDGPVEQ